MSDDKDLSYFPNPDEVVRVPGRQRGRTKLVDMSTGKQTYPIFVKRARREFLYPEDLGEERRRPTQDDYDLLRLVDIQLHNMGVSVEDGVKSRPVIEAIKELKGLGRNKAYQELYRLWHAGLVRREGTIHGASGRPMNQLWYFDT